jgi:hypothetical protein
MSADSPPEELPSPALDFLAAHFGDGHEPSPLSPEESEVVDHVLVYVEERFGTMKYILGLAIDFAILAQRLSLVDEEAKVARLELTEQELFQRYTLIERVGSRTANTLSLTFGDHPKEGIRKIERGPSRFPCN